MNPNALQPAGLPVDPAAVKLILGGQLQVHAGLVEQQQREIERLLRHR